jgi:hypothetical protein
LYRFEWNATQHGRNSKYHVVPDVPKGIRNSQYNPFSERLHVAVEESLLAAKLCTNSRLGPSYHVVPDVPKGIRNSQYNPFSERLHVAVEESLLAAKLCTNSRLGPSYYF